MDNRQAAFNELIQLADSQGYVTFDDIMNCADEYSLPIQDFDWLSNSITSRGTIVYSEKPSQSSPETEMEYDDFAQSDYEAVYKRIVELSPSLEPFVSSIKNILPPQRGEIKQLKYQIIDGNIYARTRMIEMHLRLALRVALQRAEIYDMDIEDAVGCACIGLVVAVDRYDPDTSGAFASYASLWILQNISREQSTQRPLVYYPVHKKEGYFTAYPLLKQNDCIGCDKLIECPKALDIIKTRLGCDDEDAEDIIEQMIPDERYEALYLNECEEQSCEETDVILAAIARETISDGEEVFESVFDAIRKECVAEQLMRLKPREREVLKKRFGFEGREQTLEEVGQSMNVTRERIRQIEAKALLKLRKPSFSKKLKDFL